MLHYLTVQSYVTLALIYFLYSQVHSTKILFFYSAEFSCKVEIFEQGGLEPIIKLLSSTDCDVQVKINNFLR